MATNSEVAPSGEARGTWSLWLWSLVGVAPYLLLYAGHVWGCPPGLAPTGFIQYDQPYYVANGRAVFERGNGLLGPNPYDPDPSAPSIYFHWLPWLLGLGVVGLKWDPGALYAGLGVVAALGMGRLTLALVARCGAGTRLVPIYLLAMWGGGIAVLVALAENAWYGYPWRVALLRHEPHAGWWMLPWGPNAVYATEAIYHVLMAWAWLAAMGRRWWQCLAAVGLVASTHPFGGVQVLGSFLAFGAIAWLACPRVARPPAWFIGGVVALAAAFAAYYFGYLPQHESHRTLQSVWALPWFESKRETLMAYVLVGALAAGRLLRSTGQLFHPDTLLLGSSAAVAFGLSHHHWLIAPRQPLHFTHGYVWMPLFLIGVPLLRDILGWAARTPARVAVALLVSLAACTDNLVWLGQQLASPTLHDHSLSPDVLAMFRAMNQQSLRGVLLCDDAEISYLSATYTGCRPYYGHIYNTPDYSRRKEQAIGWYTATDAGDCPDCIDLILVQGLRRPPCCSDGHNWEPCHRVGEWTLYRRTPPPKR